MLDRNETLKDTVTRLSSENMALHDRVYELEDAIRDFVEQYSDDPETWPISIASDIAGLRAALGLKP